MFWIKQRYISSVLRTNMNLSNVLSDHPIIFGCFQQKSDTFRIFWLEIRCFSNVLYQMWYFSNVLLKNSILSGVLRQIRYLFIVLNRTSIHFEWFVSKTDAFRVFRVQIQIFRMFWVNIQQVSNVFSKKLNTFQMCWEEIRFFSNVL